MISYRQILENLYTLNISKSPTLGLESIQNLIKKLGHPEKCFPSVLVAGSNGKGSTTWKMAQALRLGGYRVGLYSSPHLSCFRERIRINGEMISEEDVVEIVSQLFALKINCTYFELVTALALEYFRRQKMDIAILEVGLGGRLDATNIVDPILSIITSISLEHTEILGNTEEQICREKAGIARQGIPLVVGADVPLSPLLRFQESLTIVEKGDYEDINSALAAKGLELLQERFPLSAASLSSALQMLPPCRFEPYRDGAFILDVAHNPASLRRLANRLPAAVPWILSISQGKDLPGCLGALSGKVSHLIVTEGYHPRCLKAQELKAAWLELFPTIRCTLTSSVAEALDIAEKESSKPIIVAGTFFMMAEARAALGYDGPVDPYQLNEWVSVRKTTSSSSLR